MNRLFAIGALLAATAVAASAQDTEVRSRTNVEADDATVVSLTGCLRQDALTGRYTLIGTTAAAGDEVTTNTRIETDVDDDEVELRARTRSRADDAVGTSGTTSTYILVPRGNLSLATHVGRHVQISAVMLDPREDDAEIEINERTTIDPDDAPDRTKRSKTEIEIEDVPHGQYAVVAMKQLASSCATR